jgi:class 3 adenylate cyclase
MGLLQLEVRRIFPAPRRLVWAVVADTNRVDRAAGLSAARYRWVREDERVLRYATATELGFELEWIEPPYRWVEGRYVEGLRRFVKGPVRAGGFRVDLRDVEGGTEVNARLWVDAPFWIGWVKQPSLQRGLVRYFDAVRVLLEGTKHGEVGVEEPAVVWGRRLLADRYEPVTSGSRTATDEGTLAGRMEAFRAAPVDRDVADRIVAWVRDRPDEDVSQMRPFELADLWGTARRETLRGFLYATKAGIVELSWQVNCPLCRVAANVVRELRSLDGRSHCAACAIDYEVDFARHVEAVFLVHPAIRHVTPALYCASSPSFLPHVIAQLRLEPGERREDEMELPVGPLHLRTLWIRRTADLDLDGPPAELDIRVTKDALEVSFEGTTVPGAPTKVRTENATDREVPLLFERSGWSAAAVLGTEIASMPEFVNLFATEAPAVGVELAVGHLAILFSDLTGSTALYQQVGDARAFAIVAKHFKLMEETIDAHGGAIVKTMGDAVMASFPSERQAVAAALAMIAAQEAEFRALGLGVKIGVHAGPCLAVRANDRLDYFGTTVNLAARLQAQARANELVLTEETAEQVAIASLIRALPRRTFETHLKGIVEVQRLVGIDASSLARGVPERSGAGGSASDRASITAGGR